MGKSERERATASSRLNKKAQVVKLINTQKDPDHRQLLGLLAR